MTTSKLYKTNSTESETLFRETKTKNTDIPAWLNALVINDRNSSYTPPLKQP